jgi:putative addiction module component (TIGR02574 family)
MAHPALDIPIHELTTEEKLALIDRLRDSLPADPTPFVQPWHLELIRERLAAAKANPVPSIPLAELRREFLGDDS